MTPTNPLFTQQIARATEPSGAVDLDTLGAFVTEAYDQADRDRIAALQAREAELRTQNGLFLTAISNMTQALLSFDASERLSMWNNRFLEMYGLRPDQVKVGFTVAEIMKARQQTGTFGGDPEEYARNLLASIRQGANPNRVVELPDGRSIAVLNVPMPGGGWVSTHEDITDRRNAEKRIAHMVRHDALTDLPNRLLLRERLDTALLAVERGAKLAVLYLDLNQFKTINDTIGHQTGDKVLKMVADRLRQNVRVTDTIARVDGDEFAIIQTDIEEPVDTETLARRIFTALRVPYEVDGHDITIDASMGIALAPADGYEAESLIAHADMALRGAKADGRGTFRFFEPAMDAKMKARRTLELAMRGALEKGEFHLHYQPVVRLDDNAIIGCEALIRWDHPERGMIPPAEFIPIAEEIGLTVPIGEWVLRKACADAALWPNDVRVAVNLSPIQVRNQNLITVVMGALASAGLPARRLELEITETVLMQNTEATLIALHRLRQMGVRISLDDFGTGYSSLSYLRMFPFDKIKIDRCFVRDLPDGEEAIAIIRAVAGLAKSLGMVTTAEGVETQEQLDQVRAVGCTEMQGYLFSPPRRAIDISAMFAAQAPRQAIRA